jgi:hypothetical protein
MSRGLYGLRPIHIDQRISAARLRNLIPSAIVPHTGFEDSELLVANSGLAGKPSQAGEDMDNGCVEWQ